MIKKEMVLYLIIAFMAGMIVMDMAQALKVPDIILPNTVDPDLKEQLDYVIDIVNKGKYEMSVSGAAITSSDGLGAGELLLDNNGVTKYLCVSNGTTNYRVSLTAIP